MTRFATTLLTTAVLLTPTALPAETTKMAGMTSELPKGWEVGEPSSSMRLAQYAVPGEKKEDAAEVVIFRFPGGSGTAAQNFQRQQAKFEPAAGQDELEAKTGKLNVGPIEAEYQDLSGTYLDKFPPFAPNPKITRKENYRQIYVVFKGSDGEYYVWLQGPAATVKANEEAFKEWLKNFK